MAERVFVAQHISMSLNFPFPTERCKEPYLHEGVSVTIDNGGGSAFGQTYKFISDSLLKDLKDKQNRGAQIIDGVHPYERTSAPLCNGTVDFYVPISSNPSEVERLKSAGINLETLSEE